MSEARSQPWRREPDIANLPPDSFTAQKLVCAIREAIECSADSCSNMQRQSICTSPRGASSSALSPYVPTRCLTRCAALT